ncbi:hypothetical protein LMH87_004824 [Akanthomyces muscarius]|uniref:Uncharacterized protein n=1 Tax=Akanthomyces muscarius TaxID=2231603 RepID=A0A9W8UI17_AKAMU|nr:hypothetical protein LMH87_004824 [Akanthomyces muscarius]KAJ4145993.1 hypothetical protein LMH87_004824 [Akanthomyces muscarius]
MKSKEGWEPNIVQALVDAHVTTTEHNRVDSLFDCVDDYEIAFAETCGRCHEAPAGKSDFCIQSGEDLK